MLDVFKERYMCMIVWGTLTYMCMIVWGYTDLPRDVKQQIAAFILIPTNKNTHLSIGPNTTRF